MDSHMLQEDDPGAEVEEDEMAHLVANRMGEVLGPHAILKEDHFPGIPQADLSPCISDSMYFKRLAPLFLLLLM